MIIRLRGVRNKMTGKITHSIIAISFVSMFALGMSILPMGVYAQGGAYNKVLTLANTKSGTLWNI
jgi:hypothetical protein